MKLKYTVDFTFTLAWCGFLSFVITAGLVYFVRWSFAFAEPLVTTLSVMITAIGVFCPLFVAMWDAEERFHERCLGKRS